MALTSPRWSRLSDPRVVRQPLPQAHHKRRHRAFSSGACCSTKGGAGTLHLFSPSKINLFLRVMRRRDDGFHDLASLFHVIDLGDDMRFSLLPNATGPDRLACSDPSIPTDGRNLVIKALELFRAKTGQTARFDVALEKRVPHGAGLGGGSGNAATTLWAANELTGRPASEAQLLEWSADIGSDISVFFGTGAAYCTGRGEVVESVDPPLDLGTPLLLVKPPQGLSTPLIFKTLDLGARSTQDPRALLEGMATRRALPQAFAVNDLEPPAFKVMPSLLALKERLLGESGGTFSAVFMTGSGSTLVCVGSDKPPAFLSQDPACASLFVTPARLIMRRAGSWYLPSEAAATAQQPAVAVG